MSDTLNYVARVTYEAFIESVADLEPSWAELPESHRERLREATKAGLLALNGVCGAVISERNCEPTLLGFIEEAVTYRSAIKAAIGEES